MFEFKDGPQKAVLKSSYLPEHQFFIFTNPITHLKTIILPLDVPDETVQKIQKMTEEYNSNIVELNKMLETMHELLGEEINPGRA